jgi:hypothetical protein
MHHLVLQRYIVPLYFKNISFRFLFKKNIPVQLLTFPCNYSHSHAITHISMQLLTFPCNYSLSHAITYAPMQLFMFSCNYSRSHALLRIQQEFKLQLYQESEYLKGLSNFYKMCKFSGSQKFKTTIEFVHVYDTL